MDSPHRAAGPICVRKDARQALLAPGEVPDYATRRLMSLRACDAAGMMVAAAVCEGSANAERLDALFGDPAVAYVHLPNARQGCCSCLARRAGD